MRQPLAAALLLALAAVPAYAASYPKAADLDWSTMDANDDGELTVAEAKAAIVKALPETKAQIEQIGKDLDKDGDGVLTDSEIDDWLIAVGAKKPH